MHNKEIINIQVNKEDLEKAIIILDKLGISLNEYFNMILKQLIEKGRIPFDIE